MNFVGEKVIHKCFGEGIIIRKEEEKIVVRFSIGEKAFLFPKAFEKFLTAVNIVAEEEIKAELKKQRETEENERRKKEQEEKKREIKKDIVTSVVVRPKNHKIVDEELVCDINMSYGTNSQKIYNACCKRFNWDEDSANQFGWQCPMFAWEATPEKYHVWFLCNNNWSGSKSSTWENVISHDLQYIYEIWKNEVPSKESGYRVVFAKTSDGQYVFLGIYRFFDMKVEEQDAWMGVNRIFERVSAIYPFIEEV